MPPRAAAAPPQQGGRQPEFSWELSTKKVLLHNYLRRNHDAARVARLIELCSREFLTPVAWGAWEMFGLYLAIACENGVQRVGLVNDGPLVEALDRVFFRHIIHCITTVPHAHGGSPSYVPPPGTAMARAKEAFLIASAPAFPVSRVAMDEQIDHQAVRMHTNTLVFSRNLEAYIKRWCKVAVWDAVRGWAWERWGETDAWPAENEMPNSADLTVLANALHSLVVHGGDSWIGPGPHPPDLPDLPPGTLPGATRAGLRTGVATRLRAARQELVRLLRDKRLVPVPSTVDNDDLLNR